MIALTLSQSDPRRCVACSIELEHTAEQHEEYVAIWCEQHKTWCGNHNHRSIAEAIEHLRKTKQQSGTDKSADQAHS
jgi:hypothetical protein